MAEVTGMRNNALPYPVYGCAFTATFPLLDADGDPVSPSSPDSEVSKNGDTFADCTNEATEIATSSGICYLLLTSTEMTADIVTVRIQSTGAKTTVLTLYPRKLPVLSTGTCQGSNDTGDIQLASGDSAIDDYYNGCLCVAVIDGTTEARIINDYVGSTKVGEVSPAWNTAQPDSSDTYTIYLPEGRQVQQANTTHINSVSTSSVAAVGAYIGNATAALAVDASGRVDVSKFGGSATPITNLTTVFSTDFSTVYDSTNKAFLSKLGNFAMGGTSLILTTGGIVVNAARANGAIDIDNSAGAGINVASTSTDSVLLQSLGGNGHGLYSSGNGTGDGVHWIGGATGNGMNAQGGSTSGDGMYLFGNTAGAGMRCAGTGGNADIDADITGDITGNLSGSAGSVTGNVGGNVTGSVGSIATGGIAAASFAAGAINAAAIATGAIDADALATDAVTEIWGGSTAPSSATIAAAVWDLDATAHQTQGTFGQVIGDSGADTDSIWSLANTNLDAAVSSRMATYTQPTGFLAATFPTSVGDATAANQSTIAGYIDTEVAAILAAVDTEVAAIKAKTDNLPSDPTGLTNLASAHGAGSWATATGFAVAGDAMTLTSAYDSAKTAASATALASLVTTVGVAGAGLTDLGGFSTTAKGQINAEADTALSDAGVTLARMGALTDWIDGGRLDLILDAILADTGTDGVVVADLSAAICNKLADHVRRRTQANVEASANGDTLDLSSQYGAIQQMQESAVSGGTLTVKKTDGTTTLGTKTVTSSSSADPITGIS